MWQGSDSIVSQGRWLMKNGCHKRSLAYLTGCSNVETFDEHILPQSESVALYGSVYYLRVSIWRKLRLSFRPLARTGCFPLNMTIYHLHLDYPSLFMSLIVQISRLFRDGPRLSHTLLGFRWPLHRNIVRPSWLHWFGPHEALRIPELIQTARVWQSVNFKIQFNWLFIS